MAYYTDSDSRYDNYSSWTNLLIGATERQTESDMGARFKYTEIIARDKNGKITFHHRQKGVMKKYQIKAELRNWVNPHKEVVEINHLTL